MDKAEKVLVAGGGGFIGGHLVADLLPGGHSDIRVVDCKPLSEWYQLWSLIDMAGACAGKDVCGERCVDHRICWVDRLRGDPLLLRTWS